MAQRIAFRQYPFSVALGQNIELAVDGDYLKYAQGVGRLLITLETGETIELLPGQGLRGRAFNRIFVRGLENVNSGLLHLGWGSNFVDDRINGEVATIDGDRLRSLAGLAFMGTGFFSARAYTGAQNEFSGQSTLPPVGSTGVRVWIQKLTIIPNIATDIAFKRVSLAFLPDIVQAFSGKGVQGSGSVVRHRSDSVSVVGDPLPGLSAFDNVTAAANEKIVFQPLGGILVLGGFSLRVVFTSASVSAKYTIEYFEERFTA